MKSGGWRREKLCKEARRQGTQYEGVETGAHCKDGGDGEHCREGGDGGHTVGRVETGNTFKEGGHRRQTVQGY